VAHIGNKLQAGWSRNCVSIPGRDEAFSVLKNVQAFSGAHPVTSPVGNKVSFSARKTCNHRSPLTWSRSVQMDNINFTYCGQTVSVYRNFSNLIWSHEFHLNCMTFHFLLRCKHISCLVQILTERLMLCVEVIGVRNGNHKTRRC